MLQLWQQNRRFIAKLASRYKGYEDIEDLEQQGFIGMCSAVENYRPEEGVPFINYAAFWIRQSMARYVETCSSVVKVPTQARQNHRKYRSLVHEFEILVGRKPTDMESCCYMGISHDDLINIRNGARMEQIGSLDSYATEDDDTTIGDLVPGCENVESTVLDEMELQELKQVLWPMVDALPEEQKIVIYSRYRQRMTLAQIGELMGMSKDQARSMERKGLQGLRQKKYKLQRFLPETVESLAYHGSVGNFNRTWTSSTERVAMRI